MEGINFNKKFILIMLLMTVLFSVFFATNVKAARDTNFLMLLEDAEFYDTNGKKIGIKINAKEYLYVQNEEQKINNVSYKMTMLGANTVYIKAKSLDFNNYLTRDLITNEAAYLYDASENIIGQIDRGVLLDTAVEEGEVYYKVMIDGLIQEEKLQPATGQVGDLSEEFENNEVIVEDKDDGNGFTIILEGILKLLLETLPKILLNLFNNVNL